MTGKRRDIHNLEDRLKSGTRLVLMSNLNKSSIPQVQRALVLQGGGALGAYQAGVFKPLRKN